MKFIEKIRKNYAYRCLCEFIMRYFTDGVGRASAELAYYFLFSFFPLMVFASLLIGTFDIDVGSMRELLDGVIPDGVLNIALDSIAFLNGLQMNTLMYTGLVVSMMSASRAVSSLAIAVNRAYRIESGRHWILQIVVNWVFSAAMLGSFVITIAILLLGRGALSTFAGFFNLGEGEINAWHVIRFVPMVLLFFGLLLFLYSAVPNRHIRFRQVVPGAVAASISWLITSIGFSFYVENMSRYYVLYGSIGAVIVLMLWLYLTGVILIMGAELNHVLYVVREQRGRQRALFDSTQPLPRLPRFARKTRG
jgi:membrane protein